MDEYDKLNIAQLRALLWDRDLVPERWMLYFLKKHEACRILEANRSLTTNEQASLRRRQKRHSEKIMTAKKDRAEQFGTTKMTVEERLTAAIDRRGPLTFSRIQEFDEPFESAAGSKRGKVAVVFIDAAGEEFLLTKGEAEKAKNRGVAVPFHVFTASRKVKMPRTNTHKTMKDYWN